MSIRILDKNTINQIAAGEVIDRPASIIKELVENSIDAGATAVSIEVRGGGIDLIRISDNGCGIASEDIRVAFVRHSTSKIKDASDLYNITSLGFRGEALASIAAIADVELITKTKEAFAAVSYHICGGEELGYNEIGAPDGTTFIIRDVFKNVPVRRKFLKSAMTEGSYCNEIVERIALSHPEVSFKYINNGRTLIFTNGNGKLKNVIFGIYGRDIAEETLEITRLNTGIEGTAPALEVYGCICRPTVARSNRNTENFFVNGRFIRSAIISKAVEDAYQPYLMQHKYPFVNLFIQIDPARMDVNVHPSKQEVRFENPEIIYNAVFLACSEVLSGKALIHRMAAEKTVQKTNVINKVTPEPFEQKKTVSDKITANEHKVVNGCNSVADVKSANKLTGTDNKQQADDIIHVTDIKPAADNNLVTNDKTADHNNSVTIDKPADNSNSVSNDKTANNNKVTNKKADTVNNSASVQNSSECIKTAVCNNTTEKNISVCYDDTDNSDEADDISIVNDSENETDNEFSIPEVKGTYVQQELFQEERHVEDKKEFISVFSKGYRIVGQVFNTYWIIECNGCMYMIDQHAAHEKILYEKLMKNLSGKADAQLLSPPIIVSLTAREAELVEKFNSELLNCGYTIEEFGGREYAISSVPLNLYGNDPKALLFEILEGLSSEAGNGVTASIKDRIATCSCKAAVKGNMELSEQEAKELIKNLLEAENPFNCPHGRPIIIDMTKSEIEKKFKRIL